MANIANIAFYDGAATPVLHTLIPISVEKSRTNGKIEALWREQVATLPTYAQMEARMTLARTAKSGVWHVTFSLGTPVMESVSGQNSAGYTAAPKVAYVNTSGFFGHYHERSTIAERRLNKQGITNLLANVATSVPPVTAGLLDELIASLIMPT